MAVLLFLLKAVLLKGLLGAVHILVFLLVCLLLPLHQLQLLKDPGLLAIMLRRFIFLAGIITTVLVMLLGGVGVVAALVVLRFNVLFP